MTVEGYRRMEKRVTNTRLLTYDIKVNKMVSNSIRTMGYTDITTLGVVITNLIACLKKSNLLVYSRMTSGKKTSSREATFVLTKDIADLLDLVLTPNSNGYKGIN